MGLKLMPRLHLDLKRVKPEQSATRHLMNPAKIALLEHPARPVPQHAKLATRESLTTKTAVVARIVYKQRSKIKVPANRAKIVPRDGNNSKKVKVVVSILVASNPKIAATMNIGSPTNFPTKMKQPKPVVKIAQTVGRASVPLAKRASVPCLGGRNAPT